MDALLRSVEHIRLLECWLPLAQAMNQEFGWQRSAAALERLVLAAAPDLVRISTLDDARALLYYYAANLDGDPR